MSVADRPPPPPEPDRQVLTLREGANFMRLSERQFWTLIQQGKIPALKCGNQWRLYRSDLLQLNK